MFYWSILIFNHIFSQALPIMLALCLILLAIHYAQNYAGIIGWFLDIQNKIKTMKLYTNICLTIAVAS